MLINNLNSPLVQSIISGAEERILNMTGFSVRLVIEPQYAETEYLPKLAKQVTDIWDIPIQTLRSRSRVREVCSYKQIFVMIARQKHNLCSFKSIATYLNYCDHSMAIYSLKIGKDMLDIEDAYFMAFYEPVKHLFSADSTK